MKRNKALSLLGLAMKAGKVVHGEFAVEQAVKTKTAVLVILAGDASENTKKKFTNMCEFYHIEIKVFSDKEELGTSIGKEYRAVVAVADTGFARGIREEM